MSCRSARRSCDTAVRHAAGRPVTRVDVRIGRLRQVVPESLSFYFGLVARDTVCDGARAGARDRARAAALRALRPRVGDRGAGVPLPALRSGDVEVVSGEELEVESIEVEEAECIA